MSLSLSGQLTVYFEDPFWVGVFERQEGDKLSVCRVVFGPEPKDYEVYAFIESMYYRLPFSRGLEAEVIKKKRVNPKRLQRQIKKATETRGIRTKAQEAIQQERDTRKSESKKHAKAVREEQKRLRFQEKQEKKKQKKKGH